MEPCHIKFDIFNPSAVASPAKILVINQTLIFGHGERVLKEVDFMHIL